MSLCEASHGVMLERLVYTAKFLVWDRGILVECLVIADPRRLRVPRWAMRQSGASERWALGETSKASEDWVGGGRGGQGDIRAMLSP